VDDEKLIESAMTNARQLAARPTNAFSKIKKALDIAEHNTLTQQLEYERGTQGMF